MSSSTDAWEQALDARSGARPAPMTLPPGSQIAAGRARAAREAKAASFAKRVDIQGLRMVAVVAVIVSHLTDHPKGGFVGVDVFFVISGYLITGRLTRMLGTGNLRTYLLDFYKLRARRILPAALVVIVLTVLASERIFAGARAHQTAVDGGWAAIFWANWHEITLGTNYFTADGPVSPFQHYWSLAVEEQFYFAWPIVLFIVGFGVSLAARRRERLPAVQLAAAGVAGALLSAASLLWAFHQSSSGPVTAYFSAFTRGWELGLGALLACVVPAMPRVSLWALTAMSWLGLTLIAVSFFTVTGGSGFPAPEAIMPVVGSGLVLAATSNGVMARNVILTNPASVFVGNISYSIYLVHFPIIVLLGAKMPDKGSYFYAAAVLLTLGLSITLYGCVEQPVLNSRFLLTGAQRQQDREKADPSSGRLIIVALAITVLGLAVITTWPGADAQRAGRLANVDAALAAPASASCNAVTEGPAQRALTIELRAALLSESWPKLTPQLDHPKEGIASAAGCTVKLSTADRCTWGDKTADSAHSIYLVGDSTSTFYDDGLITMIKSLSGWRVRTAGGSACPFADRNINTHTENALVKACPQRNDALVAEIVRAKPALLVVTTVSGAAPVNQAVQAELKKVKDSVGKIVVLPAPPRETNPQQCYTQGSVPSDCEQPLVGYYSSWMTGEKWMARNLHAAFIDPTRWFCLAGHCPMFAGNVPMRLDAEHITPQYGVHIHLVMLEALRAVKALPA